MLSPVRDKSGAGGALCVEFRVQLKGSVGLEYNQGLGMVTNWVTVSAGPVSY